MNTATSEDLLLEAVEWLARMPFLGVYDLSTLLDMDDSHTQQALVELEGRGWCEWINTSSFEIEERRLYTLTEVAQNRVRQVQPPTVLPLGRREMLTRLPRLETVAGLNRFLAEFALAADADSTVDFEDARALPWTGGATGRCWPPDVDAYACLRWLKWSAPAYIAWDRAAVPLAHRRKRVAGWYTYVLSRRWDTMPIVVICPGEREAEQWSQAVINSADRRACPQLTVILATVQEAQRDPIGEIWRRVDGRAQARLFVRLTRVLHAKVPIQPTQLPAIDLERLAVNKEPLRKWAKRATGDQNGSSGLEQVAALSLTTGGLEKKALDWISHHTLLDSSDLSALMNVPEPLSGQLLASLEGHGLCQRFYRLNAGETEAPRYLLTSLGLRLLASRDGVPPRHYARFGVIAAPDEGKKSRRLDTLVSQFEHTVGANSFFVRLARDLRIQGGRLTLWTNPSESTRRFTHRGERRWLRPDGYAELVQHGRLHRFFLEWDRGTTRDSEHLIEKFQNYADYSAARGQVSEPDLVIVTVSQTRETAIWKTLAAVFGELPVDGVYSTVDSMVARLGPLAAIWRASASLNRERWVARHVATNVASADVSGPEGED